MSEKRIEIKIAATGGDQAAAEVKKVETASKDLTEAEKDYQERKAAFEARRASGAFDRSSSGAGGTGGMGGMLDKIPEQAQAATGKVEDLDEMVKKLVEDMGEASEETKKAGKAAEDAGPKLDKIVNNQRAEVATKISDAIGKIGGSVREAAKKFEASDPEFSKTLANTATGLETMASAAGLAAQGFAVGGPLGAAIGALVGTMLPDLKVAMDDMVKSMEAAATSEAAAEQSVKMLAAAHNMGIDAYRNALDAIQGYQQKTDELTKSIDAQTAAMEKRNRVRDAKDSADAAERDNADAAEIRAGAATEDVESRRAMHDAEVAKAKVARELEAKRLAQVTAADTLLQAGRNVEAVTNDPTLRTKDDREKKIAEEKRKQQAAQKAFDDAQNDFEIARETSGEENRKIDLTTRGKVISLADKKSDRLQKEKDAKKRIDDAEDARKQRQQQQDEIESRQEAVDGRAKGVAQSFDAAGQRGGGKAGKVMQDIGKGLADGTNLKELEKMNQELVSATQGLSSATVAGQKAVLEELKKAQKDIENLKGQLRKSRDMK